MTQHSMYIVMIDYGRRGLESVVDPEITRRGVIARISTGEYTNIAYILHIEGGYVFDVTDELMHEAGVVTEDA